MNLLLKQKKTRYCQQIELSSQKFHKGSFYALETEAKEISKRKRERVVNPNFLNFIVIFQATLALRSRKFPPPLPSPEFLNC